MGDAPYAGDAGRADHHRAVSPAAGAAGSRRQRLQFTVPIQIAGNGQYFDQSGTTTVTVQNTALQPFLPGLLFYDDDPEHVSQDGVLFRGTVSLATPARIYYYHDDLADPRRLVVALRGGSQDPTSVQLIEAKAGPNMDVMQVGDSVSKRFLLTKNQHEGVVLDLSGDQPYLVTDLPMTARQLVAGTADLRVLSGGPVEVTVLAVSPGVDPRTLLDGPVLPGDGHHRTGAFSIAGFGERKPQFFSRRPGRDDRHRRHRSNAAKRNSVGGWPRLRRLRRSCTRSI